MEIRREKKPIGADGGTEEKPNMEDQTGSSETDVRAYPDRRSTIVIHGIARLD